MTAWLVETLFAVTLLMLLVLAVRRPVAHFFGAGWAYALWLLPALRLVLPPLHLFGADAPSLLPRMAAAPAVSAEVVAVPLEAPVEAFQWEPALLALWAAGAVLFIVWQAWCYFSFLRRLGIGSQVHASLAQDIGIIESHEVEGPMAIGLLDKWIVVPADFTSRYSLEEQRLALQHERVHHQREDIFWNMVALAVLALNWFNPVAYAAFRAFRSDQELSCDAAVAAQASAADRHDYARALVKSASKPGLIAACPLNHAGQLKRRLKMMKAHRRSRLRALGGSSAVAALLLAGISVTETPGVAAPEAAPAVEPPQAAAPAAAPAGAAAAPGAAPAPRATAAKAAPRAPARAKARVAVAAPAAPAPVAVETVEVEEVAELQPAAPSPVPVSVHVVKPADIVVLDGSSRGREFRVVRTHVRTAREITPELKAKIEQFLAHEVRLSSFTAPRFIHSIKMTGEKQ